MASAVRGWPEFACWTASIARVRIVLIESWSWFTLSSHQQPHLPIERLLGGDIHLVARLRRLQNRPRELGMVTKHAVEVALVEHEEVAVLPGADGGGARLGEEQADLAEEAAGAERREGRAVPVEDLDLTVHQDVHLAADVALPDDQVAGRVHFRLERHGDVVLEDGVTGRKERHLLDHAAVDDLEPLAAVALDQVEGGLRSPRSRGVVREVLGGAGRPDGQDGLGGLSSRLHPIRPWEEDLVPRAARVEQQPL